MDRMVKLPFYENPIFTTYNKYSFVTGIIQGNYNGSFEPWAYGRYINCAFNPGFGFRIFGYPDIMNVNTDLIRRVNSVRLPRIKWMDYWKSLLDDSIYIQANINEQYIPGKWAWNIRL